jgi:hypothetical protein
MDLYRSRKMRQPRRMARPINLLLETNAKLNARMRASERAWRDHKKLTVNNYAMTTRMGRN